MKFIKRVFNLFEISFAKNIIKKIVRDSQLKINYFPKFKWQTQKKAKLTRRNITDHLLTFSQS
jgi:hypothetical protein